MGGLMGFNGWFNGTGKSPGHVERQETSPRSSPGTSTGAPFFAPGRSKMKGMLCNMYMTKIEICVYIVYKCRSFSSQVIPRTQIYIYIYVYIYIHAQFLNMFPPAVWSGGFDKSEGKFTKWCRGSI